MFRRLSCQTWDPLQHQDLADDVAMTMAMMEITFPPNFFDIMSHMPYHLVQELDLCGPNQVRWMYPLERNMRALKDHVKNKAHHEASIMHGYLFQETQGFVSEYLQGFKPVQNRVWDADLEDANEYVVLEGTYKSMILSNK